MLFSSGNTAQCQGKISPSASQHWHVAARVDHAVSTPSLGCEGLRL
ncbi:MAG: hypothetical protein ACKOCF_06010 [Gammaproteobacteria bacterium]